MPDFKDVTNEVVNGGLPGVSNGMALWGDYDKDGDLDFCAGRIICRKNI